MVASAASTTGPEKCRLEKIRRETPTERCLPSRERGANASNGAKAFESSADSPAPRETAPELQTEWRWVQSRANSSLRVIPCSRDFCSDFSAWTWLFTRSITEVSLGERVPKWSHPRNGVLRNREFI